MATTEQDVQRLLHFELLTAEQIKNSPSRRDGIPEEVEAAEREYASQKIWSLCAKDPHLPDFLQTRTGAIAVTIYNRFYSRRSLRRNSSFIIAAASLILASKLNDDWGVEKKILSPRKVVREFTMRWHSTRDKNSMKEREYVNDPERFQQLLDKVYDAESLILVILGFDLEVVPIQREWVRVMQQLNMFTTQSFLDFLVSLSRTICCEDGTMLLQYTTNEVALAMLDIVARRGHAKYPKDFPNLENGPDGQPWYTPLGLSLDTHKALAKRINYFFDRPKNKKRKDKEGTEPVSLGVDAWLASQAGVPSETTNANMSSYYGHHFGIVNGGYYDDHGDNVAAKRMRVSSEEVGGVKPKEEEESELEEGEIEEGEIVD